MSEQEIISQYFSRHQSDMSVDIGVGDDAAVVTPPKNTKLVITTDTLNIGIHFDHKWLPENLGHKSLAVSLSDLAAMGAVPLWATINLSLPEIDHQWLKNYSDELFSLADRFNTKIIGGDLVKGPLSITVQAIGFIEGEVLSRSSAKAGDLIFVTGTIGDAVLGLKLQESQGAYALTEQDYKYFTSRFYNPEPRVNLGQQIKKIANAAIDISDGLLIDLQHILEQSNAGAVIEIENVPVSAAMKKQSNYLQDWETIFTGGDDYELLFTVDKKFDDEINVLSKTMNCPISNIGHIKSGSGVELLHKNKPVPLPAHQGFDHFA